MNYEPTSDMQFFTCFYGAYDPRHLDTGDNLFFDAIYVTNWDDSDTDSLRADEAAPTILTVFTDKPVLNSSPDYKILKIQMSYPPYDEDGVNLGRAATFTFSFDKSNGEIKLFEDAGGKNIELAIESFAGKMRISQLSTLIITVMEKKLIEFNQTGHSIEGDFILDGALDVDTAQSLIAKSIDTLAKAIEVNKKLNPPSDFSI